MLFQSSNNTFIQKKINNPNIQYPIVIIPALTYIVAYNDFGEGIAGQSKRLVLSFRLSCIVKGIGRLNISLFAAQGGDEVDLTGNLNSTAFFVPGVAVNNAHIHRAATDDELVVDNVFHDMGHFLLADSQSSFCPLHPSVCTR